MNYNKLKKDGSVESIMITLSEYIRHQIYHPENTNNMRYTKEQLKTSIDEMRIFLEKNVH